MQFEHIENLHIPLKLQKKNGATTVEYGNGKIIKRWWLDDKLHRDDGPAYIEYRNGVKKFEWWFINGKPLTKEDFTSIEMIDRMKAYSFFSPVEIAKMRKNET